MEDSPTNATPLPFLVTPFLNIPACFLLITMQTNTVSSITSMHYISEFTSGKTTHGVVYLQLEDLLLGGTFYITVTNTDSVPFNYSLDYTTATPSTTTTTAATTGATTATSATTATTATTAAATTGATTATAASTGAATTTPTVISTSESSSTGKPTTASTSSSATTAHSTTGTSPLSALPYCRW